MNKLLNKKNFIIGVLIFFILIIIFTSRNLYEQKITDEEISLKNFPIPKDNIKEPNLSANSFLSVFIYKNGVEKILIKKNKDVPFPIASITKLMTAIIASEIYGKNDIISISENSLKDKGLSGIYKKNDSFTFSNALNALLISSHNEIAKNMAEQIGEEEFLNNMNKKSDALGLENTKFVNVSGLDQKERIEEINKSTVFDIYKLIKYIEKNNPNIIKITNKTEFNLFDVDGNFIKKLKTTNKLLEQKDLPFRILGGKTGETPRAKQNLVIVHESPCDGKIFNVLLNSENSFDDMKKMMLHVNDSYTWNCSQI